MLGKDTHNPPRAKIIITPAFCRVGSLSDFSVGMGRIRMTESDRMLNDALKNHENFLLTQCAPRVDDQKPEIGMQAKMLIEMV
jgi:hypothetical protein